VLSGRGLCEGLITRPEESYRLWRVVVCDLETSWIDEALAHWGWVIAPKTNFYSYTICLILVFSPMPTNIISTIKAGNGRMEWACFTHWLNYKCSQNFAWGVWEDYSCWRCRLR